MGSNGAPPCVSDEPAPAAQEILDQKLNEAWQVDPSLARIPDGTSARDGGRIDARRVSADVLRIEQEAVVAMSHLMIMTPAQLLILVVGIPSQPSSKAQPTQTRLLSRQSAVTIYAGHPEPMVRLPPHACCVQPGQGTPGRTAAQHILGEQDHVRASPSQLLGRGSANHAAADDGDLDRRGASHRETIRSVM